MKYCPTCGTPHPDDVETSHHPDGCKCRLSLCGGSGPEGCIWMRVVKRAPGESLRDARLFAFAEQARLIAERETAVNR